MFAQNFLFLAPVLPDQHEAYIKINLWHFKSSQKITKNVKEYPKRILITLQHQKATPTSLVLPAAGGLHVILDLNSNDSEFAILSFGSSL